MREIKFEYILKDLLDGNIHKLKYYLQDIEKGAMYDLAKNQYVQIIASRQYTGMIDKNGVEIYEGDIVTHKGEYLSLKKPAFVIFENGRFVMDCGNGDTNRLYKWSDGWSIEVIGNIYENTELVEQK